MHLTPSIVLVLIISSFSVFAQPKFKSDKPHPRLLLLATEEENLKDKLRTDFTYNLLHNVIIKECGKLLKEPPVERTLIGRRLLRVSREAERRIFYLSYAFRMTGDERYLTRAEKEMLTVAAFPDWNPSHFLDVAEMTLGVAIGYDWLFDHLSDNTKATLENAIVTKGLQPSLLEQNSSWAKASHNWNQVCNASLTFGALAVQDKYPDLASKIIQRSINSVKLAMDEYLPDGVYPEGYGYWNYGTTFNVFLISALEKALGSSFGLGDHPGFLRTPSYLLNMIGSSGWPFNYSDCDPKPHLNPAMTWFAAKLNDPSLLFNEKQIIDGGKNLHRVRELPALMVWAKDINLSRIPAPAESQFVGGGRNPVALLRTDWKPSSIYIGLKAGSALVTHSHMDAGSFVLDAMGERWAMDLGGQDYNSLESKGVKLWSMKQESDRWKVFRISNHSHNTLTFNRSIQRMDGVATILGSTDRREFRSAVTDLSSIYAVETRKAHRGVAIVDEAYAVVRDEIELRIPSTIRWNMITDADVQIIDSKTASLRKKGKTMLLRINEPADAVLTTWSTVPPGPHDAPNPGTTFVGFEVSRKPSEQIVFEVSFVPDSGEHLEKKPLPPLKQWLPSAN